MPNGTVTTWVDRHRIAGFLIVTYAFTWTVQGLLASWGMEASWTHSILIGFGAFGPPVGAAVVVYGGERLANREVPGPEHVGLD